jgi:hypothetical protein
MAPFRAKRWKTIWIIQSPWAISWHGQRISNML